MCQALKNMAYFCSHIFFDFVLFCLHYRPSPAGVVGMNGLSGFAPNPQVC